MVRESSLTSRTTVLPNPPNVRSHRVAIRSDDVFCNDRHGHLCLSRLHLQHKSANHSPLTLRWLLLVSCRFRLTLLRHLLLGLKNIQIILDIQHSVTSVGLECLLPDIGGSGLTGLFNRGGLDEVEQDRRQQKSR